MQIHLFFTNIFSVTRLFLFPQNMLTTTLDYFIWNFFLSYVAQAGLELLSSRDPHDDLSYLQKFTPRKGKKTQSERNLKLVKKLEGEKRMRPSGYLALGLENKSGKDNS